MPIYMLCVWGIESVQVKIFGNLMANVILVHELIDL